MSFILTIKGVECWYRFREYAAIVPAGILPGARAVNLSNSTGHLSLIPGDELKQNFSSPLLTVNELMLLFVANAKGDNREQVSKVAINALDIHSPYYSRGRSTWTPRPDTVVNSVRLGCVNTDMASQKAPIHLFLLPEDYQNL